MIEILREVDMSRIGLLQGLLESNGIKTFVRNEFLSATEVMIPAFYPALCIVDDNDLQRAIEVIRKHEREFEGDADREVHCHHGGEDSPGTFAVCWSCGTELPHPRSSSQ